MILGLLVAANQARGGSGMLARMDKTNMRQAATDATPIPAPLGHLADGGALAGNPSPHIRDRIKEFRRIRASQLLPNLRNWRRHPKAQADALRDVLREVGYASALIVRELPDGQFELIDGHLRAEITPDTEVPVLILDVNAEEAAKILLTHDPLAAMAQTDSERIKDLIETVRTESESLQRLIRETAGDKIWEAVHPGGAHEVEVSCERADELKSKWRTEPGQLWRVREHLIVCGDSRNQTTVAKLWSNERRVLQMIWTDPPYGVSYGAKTDYTNRHRAGSVRRPIENDSLAPEALRKLFAGSLAIAKEHAMPGAAVYASVPSVFLKHFIQGLEDAGFSYKHCLIWLKQTFVLGRSDYHYRHEPILYGWLENGPHFFGGDRSHDSVFEVDRPMTSELHPTTKPTELIAKMISNSSRPGELVYDPFAGSGSTLIAAHQLGRIGLGCEIDPGYVAVVLERFSLLGLKPERVER